MGESWGVRTGEWMTTGGGGLGDGWGALAERNRRW